jgi:hypothetical protein
MPFRTRQELQDHLRQFWPELSEAKPQRQAPLAEAAATALVGDLYQEWPPV